MSILYNNKWKIVFQIKYKYFKYKVIFFNFFYIFTNF